MKLDHYLTPYAKINSKWTKDLNVRSETIKFLEESIGGKLLDTGLSNDFFFFDTKRKGNKSKNKQIGLPQPKKLLHRKRNIFFSHLQMKRQSMEWKKMYANHIFHKRLISKIYDEPIQLNSKKTNDPLKSGQSI